MYDFINKLSYDLGFGTWVNFLIGMITTSGFISLVYKEKFHFLIITIFFAMFLFFNLSANRQALAMGLIFWAWSLMNGNSKSIFKINVLFFMASIIHTSAVFPWFLTVVSNSDMIIHKRYQTFVLFIIMVAGTYLLPILVYKFAMARMHPSHAAFVRLSINVVPAIIFLSNQKIFKNFPDYNLLYWLSLAAIGLLFGCFFSSTIADRLGIIVLYCSPLY